MKVKNKLRIISVIGVFVVLLTLIGFTFAYYKNILKGNGEKNSAYKINPTPFKVGTLAYEIYNNALKGIDGRTKYSATPETVPARDASRDDERTLSKTEDDYGDSYYYRGNVTDNYISFSGKCFKIVRIQGDGSIKIILEDNNAACSSNTQDNSINAKIGTSAYGYKIEENDYFKFNFKFDYENNSRGKEIGLKSVKEQIDDWIDNLSAKDKLKEEDWCLGNSTDWYDSDGNKAIDFLNKRYSAARKRLLGYGEEKNATLKCNGVNDEKVSDKGGLLTADEVAFAGSTWSAEGDSNWSHYLKNTNIYWWLATPSYRDFLRDGAFFLEYFGYFNTYDVDHAKTDVRPAVVLKSGTQYLSGDGTKGNAYTIK